MLPTGTVFEMAVAAAHITTEETSAPSKALCDAAVGGTAKLGLSAADPQLVCRLDLATGGVAIESAAQTLLTGCLCRPASVLITGMVGKIADSCMPFTVAALVPQHAGTAMASVAVSKQTEATGSAAMLDTSLALDAASLPTQRLAYGYVPAVRACAALAAQLPAYDRNQPSMVQATHVSTAEGRNRVTSVGVLDKAGLRQLTAAGLALGTLRAASGAGWLRASTAPALATAWRPIAVPPSSATAKPAKWLIVSSLPTPLSTFCALPSSGQAILHISNVVYQPTGTPPGVNSSTIVVRSKAELTAAMTASRADHMFCVCNATEASSGGSLGTETAAAAMLWAFRARARSSATARLSLITFGHHAVGCDKANAYPVVAATHGARSSVRVFTQRHWRYACVCPTYATL